MILKKEKSLLHSTPLYLPFHWTWIHTFVLSLFFFQIILLFPQIGILRVPIRVATFATSLLFLILFGAKGERHPATIPAIVVMMLMVLNFAFHPLINSFTSGLAQSIFYLAILAPLLWVTGLKITPKSFESLIVMMWIFYTLSAGVGVLQMYFPGQFQPVLSTTLQKGVYGGQHLLITLASGEQVYRPMGLTDQPGGAATAGLYAILFGVFMALKHRNPLFWAAGAGTSAIGLFCIFLSQTRAILVISVVCLLFFAFILLRTAQFSRLTMMLSGVTALFAATFTWAIAVGGKSTLERLNSLFADKAENVYGQNRGGFLQDTIENLLPNYPLGAGLGRYGMMNQYFGDRQNRDAQPFFVEIQWQGWVLDGGIPMILCYVGAVLVTCYTTYKIAINRELGDFALFGGLIFGYNIGAIAMTFSYAFFMSQDGMLFWLLNTALFVAARNYKFNKNKDTISQYSVYG
jgi:hypothetical protein